MFYYIIIVYMIHLIQLKILIYVKNIIKLSVINLAEKVWYYFEIFSKWKKVNYKYNIIF